MKRQRFIEAIASGGLSLAVQRRAVILLAGVLGNVPVHGMEPHAMVFSSVEIHQNEIRFGAHEGYIWDARAWVGTDDEKLVFKAEGEREFGENTESSEIQLLYSTLISDFFDAQVGLRHDFKPYPSRTYAVFSLEGLAPYFIEVEASVFFSEKADVSARFEAEYDLLITRQWVLQPLLEFNFHAQSVEEQEVSAGVTDMEFGLRLRYELSRTFAPYIGLIYERDLFAAETLTRARGEDPSHWALTSGIRFSF